MQNANQTPQAGPMDGLIQEGQFVGWVYQMDYEQALILTRDEWKLRAMGVPLHCFLVAVAGGKKAGAPREIVLLRVTDAAALPLDGEAAQGKIEACQGRAADQARDDAKDEFQYGGLKCRVLGTFYERDGRLLLGSDIESYASAAQLAVYRPTGTALEMIVNFISPERAAAAGEEARRLGLKGELPRFPIGTVRYASTDRLHRGDGAEPAAFHLNAVDFLARRTAVFGMTRTGKSNTVKQLVSVVMRTGLERGLKIGQIIYDLNGEYANANQQDKGSIAEVYPEDTIRYRMIPTPGFEPMLNNFYRQVAEGHNTLRGLIEGSKLARSADIEAFLSLDFEEPRKEDSSSDHDYQRQLGQHRLKLAAYQTMLTRAGYEPPPGFDIRFEINPGIRQKVNRMVDPANGLTPAQAYDWFDLARNIQDELITIGGASWIGPDTNVLMNLLLQKNDQGGYIPGFRLLQPFKDYHSPSRTTDVCNEIYDHLTAGKIVILDLSVGDPVQRERLGNRIARHIFKNSMAVFNAGRFPPHVVVYVEEAHNIIGRTAALTEIWPTIAKEGAKARIAMVYATQEVSSLHPNILANTENILVSHLNNENEISELGKYYDFRDFAVSLIRAQDVGFARVKTLSNPFVIPVQIDKFDPEREKQHAARAKAGPPGDSR
jgi:Helicase HerA, central domain